MKNHYFLPLLFLIAACSSYHLPAVPEPPDYCIGPAGPHWQPVICVDETNLTATQRVTVVFDVEPADGKTPSSRPSMIFWRTHHQFNLQIDFADKSCVDQVQCNGQGHCSAIVKPLEMVNGVRQNRRCTYRMLDGSSTPAKPGGDADLVVTPCCF